MTHAQFVKAYNEGTIRVAFQQHVANHLVESPLADKYNKPAHYFWICISFGLSFVAPIILLFVNWLYAIGAFIFGRFIWSATKKSAIGFAARNMLKDERFYNYAIRQPGVSIVDSNGDPIDLVG